MSTSDNLLKPGETIRPRVDESVVSELVNRIFGLKTISCKELKSYDDRNFFIKVDSEVKNPHIESSLQDGCVLKILNAMDSKKEEFIQEQNEGMAFLKRKGFLVSEPLRTVDGVTLTKETFSLAENQPGQECIVRLLTYIPLKTLFEVTYTEQLTYEAGEYTGKIHQALKDFSSDILKRRESIWMMENIPYLTTFLHAIKEKEKLHMFKEIIDCWNSKVVPVESSFEKGFIHGDVNEQNLLVGRDEKDSSYHIRGLIDFGDLSYSSYVFELATVICYLMIESTLVDPLDVGGHILAGYVKQREVPEQELQILKVCVSARLTQSLVMGAYSYMNDPGNEYLLTTAEKGWKVLKSFWKVPEDQVISRWKDVMSKKTI